MGRPMRCSCPLRVVMTSASPHVTTAKLALLALPVFLLKLPESSPDEEQTDSHGESQLTSPCIRSQSWKRSMAAFSSSPLSTICCVMAVKDVQKVESLGHS